MCVCVCVCVCVETVSDRFDLLAAAADSLPDEPLPDASQAPKEKAGHADSTIGRTASDPRRHLLRTDSGNSPSVGGRLNHHGDRVFFFFLSFFFMFGR